ncbi:protoglobin domain-containing protein [Fluviispira vulneris]|uniref:protoglobin domain-containing protein n=1 Tax=Fluviispira vulneris TaxID=2763012 RepID=UPI00164929AB|nr:protoglobin domain-containing protein [Fluviispira vulneris]
MINTVIFNDFAIDFFKENDIAALEASFGIDANTKIKAYSLHTLIKQNIQSIINEFYDFNINNEKSRKYFIDQGEIEHLMKINQDYFPYIFSGPFDREYYTKKLKIGYLHYIRLIPKDIYMASIGNLNTILNRLWANHFKDPIQLYEYQTITNNLLFAEIYFTLNTYYTFSELNYQNEKAKVNEILDNIQDAYFIINKNLVISDIVSKSCYFIFDQNIASKKIENICKQIQMNKSEIFILSIKQFFDNILEINTVLQTLPKVVEIFGKKSIKLSYSSIFDKDKNPDKIIVCASDISEHIKEQKRMEEDYQRKNCLIYILENKSEFNRILNDISNKNSILLDCENSDQGKLILHEYKNWLSKFHLTHISTLINNLELEIIEKEKFTNPCLKEFFSLASFIISNELIKFLDENFEIIGIRKKND